MRNPIRLKNMSWRLAPYYALGAVALLFAQPSWTVFSLGLVPVALGVALRTWGTGHLVKNDRFTVTGPYAYLRHPLYAGTILLAVGFSIMLGGFATVLVLGFVLPWFTLHYFPRKERVESERLEDRYGAAFVRYRESVPALWPSHRPFRVHEAAPASCAGVAPGVLGVRWSAACYDANNEQGTLLAIVFGVCCVALRIAWL